MPSPGEPQTQLSPASPGQSVEPLGLERYTRKMIVGIIFAVLVASALALFGDLRDIGDAFRGFNWWLIAPILLLTCFNYGLRWVKWELYLRVLDLPRPSRWESVNVYLSAFSMSVTPGKLGELIKAVFMRRLTGAPVARTTALLSTPCVARGWCWPLFWPSTLPARPARAGRWT